MRETLLKNQRARGSDLHHQIERWSYPKWDRSGHVIEQEPEPEEQKLDTQEQEETPKIELPTAAELQQIRDDAYQEGYASGVARGQEEGRQQGIPLGKKEGHELGQQEGYEAGKKLGHDEAYKDAEKELSLQQQVLTQTLTQLKTFSQSQEQHMEQAMVSMVIQICQNLLLKELDKDPELIQSIVKKVIQSLPENPKNIQIRVHPDQVEAVQKAAQQSDESWVVSADENLLPGGCAVTTSQSQVDYTLEHRFRQQISALLAETDLSEEVINHLIEPLPEQPEGPVMPGEDSEQLESVQADISSELDEINQLMENSAEPSGFKSDDQPAIADDIDEDEPQDSLEELQALDSELDRYAQREETIDPELEKLMAQIPGEQDPLEPTDELENQTPMENEAEPTSTESDSDE